MEDSGVLMKDLLAELGVSPRRAKEIRDRHLCNSDYFLKSTGRGRPSYYLTGEGETKVRIYAECKESEPQIVPTFEDVIFLHPAPNKQKCYAKLDFGDGNGWRKIEVRIPPRLHSRLKRGRPMKVEVVRDATGVTYRHEDLATNY